MVPKASREEGTLPDVEFDDVKAPRLCAIEGSLLSIAAGRFHGIIVTKKHVYAIGYGFLGTSASDAFDVPKVSRSKSDCCDCCLMAAG